MPCMQTKNPHTRHQQMSHQDPQPDTPVGINGLLPVSNFARSYCAVTVVDAGSIARGLTSDMICEREHMETQCRALLWDTITSRVTEPPLMPCCPSNNPTAVPVPFRA